MKLHCPAILFSAAVLAGCTANKKNSVTPASATMSQPAEPAAPATQPAIADKPDVATPEYWYALPTSAIATGDSFETVLQAAEEAARFRLFAIDRRDLRNGVVLTAPETSSQVFEPWRQDQKSAFGTAQSSLATIRRTIRYDIRRTDAGTFEISTRVLVERYAQAENRVTSVVLYRSALKSGARTSDTPYGTRETDRGIFLDRKYWYPTGRDEALEASISRDIAHRIEKSVRH